MGSFTDQITADLDNVFFNTEEFAFDIVYTPKATGTGLPIKALVAFGGVDNIRGNSGDGYTWTLICERDVRSDFSRGSTRTIANVVIKSSDIPEPRYRDRITIDGKDYRVTEVFDNA